MELSFNLIHIDAVWADSVMVLVSTTDNDPGSFTMIDYINCPIDWTEYATTWATTASMTAIISTLPSVTISLTAAPSETKAICSRWIW